MKKVILLAIVLMFMPCNNAEQYNKIVGEWECVNWTSVGSDENKCNNNVYFQFNQDKTYVSKIGRDDATGAYKIVNGLLYSTPKGKMEIAVEINVLNSDTLQFTMSRSGNKEILTLLKKD